MQKVYAAELSFPFARGLKQTGVYVEEHADGSLACVGYWREGRLEVGAFLSDSEAWLQKNEYFQLADDGDGQLDEFRAWLNDLAFPEITNRAKAWTVCSFCGKRNEEVRKLVRGPRGGICNECIAICSDIVKEPFV